MTEVKTNDRERLLDKLREDRIWDVVVIGGGATGAGIVLDAASRGLSAVLFEAKDFSAGTSSKSTKLIHGGVRYLKNPCEWGLVREALRERDLLLKNAPGIVEAKEFILPCYSGAERAKYSLGLAVYSGMACGRNRVGKIASLSRNATLEQLPGIRCTGLKGGVQFGDGQFDDAKLNIALIRTALEKGALAFNYMPVVGINRRSGMIRHVTVKDAETGEEIAVRAKAVFNAAGVWADDIRRMIDPNAEKLVRASRGSHIVVDRSFMPGEKGMLIPKTKDGRVLFAIPWHGALLIGTTDIEQDAAEYSPEVTEEEIDFMLRTASEYLENPISREDVKASFAGLRPLYGPDDAIGKKKTAAVSRDFEVISEFGNMITVTGGKWTSYRKIAEEALMKATLLHLVPARECVTKNLALVYEEAFDTAALEKEALLSDKADASVMRYAVHARDTEFARNAADVLFRRLRVGLLDERRTAELMPKVEAALRGEVPEALCEEAACGVPDENPACIREENPSKASAEVPAEEPERSASEACDEGKDFSQGDALPEAAAEAPSEKEVSEESGFRETEVRENDPELRRDAEPLDK